MKNGAPFNAVFGKIDRLDEVERAAMAINFSIFEGADFDWGAMRFKDKK